jgi:hypothetical protein
MLRLNHLRLVTALAVALMGGAACGSDSPTSVAANGAPADVAARRSTGTPALLACPSSSTESATGVIGALGGVLSVGGTSVVIPANAVLAPTSFTLTVPASPYVEIEVTAGGADHFVFEKAVLVSIDYGRCGSSSLFAPAHQAWNIDPDSKALLEQMAGVDVKLTHTVVFSTIHFSGYALVDFY